MRAKTALSWRLPWLVLLLLGPVACAAEATTPLPPTQAPATATVTIAPSPPPATTAAPSATATLAPTATRDPEAVAILQDVIYAEALQPGAHTQLVDIYIPGSPRLYPVVIWSHGSNQDKSTGLTLARLLARNGFLVLAIDWRDDVESQARLREAMENADCALRLAAAQAEEIGLESQQVIWSGFSAGAFLGSLIAFRRDGVSDLWDATIPVEEAPPPQVSCAAAAEPASVTGLVASGGVYPAELWLETGASEPAPDPLFSGLRPFAAIGENPSLRVRLIQGTNDVLAPLDQAQVFAGALEEAGYDVALFAEQGGHKSFVEVMLAQILALGAE